MQHCIGKKCAHAVANGAPAAIILTGDWLSSGSGLGAMSFDRPSGLE